MSLSIATVKSTLKTKFITPVSAYNRSLATFGAACAGFIAAVPLTIAFMMPAAGQAVATRTVTVRTAADTLSCTQAATATTPVSGNGGTVLADETTTPATPAGGQGGDTPTTPFVQQMVGGSLTANGTIGNTGPDSTNSVTSNQTVTNTVSNTNNLNVTNTNAQNATTGSATVEGNTTGGSAVTGDAWNNSTNSFSYTVNN